MLNTDWSKRWHAPILASVIGVALGHLLAELTGAKQEASNAHDTQRFKITLPASLLMNATFPASTSPKYIYGQGSSSKCWKVCLCV